MFGVPLLLLATAALIWAYALSKFRLASFRKTGVGFLEPYPIFGNLLWTLLGMEHLSIKIKNIYDSFPADIYVAIFELFNPTIIIRDLELIKMITIKNFDHFHDIPFNIDKEVDPLMGNILLSLKGRKWRHMRSTLSPAFTSSKMKLMYHFMRDCAAKFVLHYEDQCSATGCLAIDVKDLTTRYTSDVIASTTFNLNVDSLSMKDNPFYDHAKSISTIDLKLVIKFLGIRLFPSLIKAFKISLFPGNSAKYLKSLVLDTMTEREERNIRQKDMLQLLIDARKGTLTNDTADDNEQFAPSEELEIKWTDDDLVAQAIGFIAAGYGTTSTVLSFLFYELALNEDIQTKLQNEIDNVIKEHGENVNYNVILNMSYMDMAISEVLRKWPPIPSVNRLCDQEYDLGFVRDNSKESIKLQKGDSIWIPIRAIHLDPHLWPDPDKFDPERFSIENRPNIKPNSYLPFGSGPRNCIGSRFSLLQMKVLAFHLLSKFQFDVNIKTPVPMEISTTNLFIDSKHGFCMDIKKRCSN